MKKILLALLFILFTTNFSHAIYFEASSHETGQVTLHIDGDAPFSVYRSMDNEDFSLISTTTSHLFTEYGLDSGKTYYYKVIDVSGNEATSKYSTTLLFKQLLPLSINDLEDNSITIEWDNIDFNYSTIYLNDMYYQDITNLSSYTVYNLLPNAQYEIYLINRFGVKSNTISFRTTNYFDKLDKLLAGLFINDSFFIDSDNDGLIDALEGISSKMDDLVNKIGGTTITDVRTIIEEVDYSTGIEDLENLPKIVTNYKGLELKIFDLNDIRYLEMMESIRLLVLAILTVTFIFLVLTFVNITFKV